MQILLIVFLSCSMAIFSPHYLKTNKQQSMLCYNNKQFVAQASSSIYHGVLKLNNECCFLWLSINFKLDFPDKPYKNATRTTTTNRRQTCMKRAKTRGGDAEMREQGETLSPVKKRCMWWFNLQSICSVLTGKRIKEGQAVFQELREAHKD